MKTSTIFFAALLLFGCSSSPGPLTPGLGEKFSLSVGQYARIGFTGKLLSFDTVLEDSRCPKGVICLWAGNARVGVTFSGVHFSLNTVLAPRDTLLQGCSIELVSLEPYPEIGRMPDSIGYKATFIVKGE